MRWWATDGSLAVRWLFVGALLLLHSGSLLLRGWYVVGSLVIRCWFVGIAVGSRWDTFGRRANNGNVDPFLTDVFNV